MTPQNLNSRLKIFLISLKIKITQRKTKRPRKKKAYQKSLRTPKTRNDLIDKITDQGYIVGCDLLGDDNCQFWALCNSL